MNTLQKTTDMGEETRQQTIENTRNKVVSQYTERIETLQRDLLNETIRRATLQGRKTKLKSLVGELEAKVKQQSMWIERMQEFVNMPPDMQQKEIQAMRDRQERDRMIKEIFDSPLMWEVDKYF